jgi:hypothetical protein
MLCAWQRKTPPRTWLTRAMDLVQYFRMATWYRKTLRFLKYRFAPALFALFTVYTLLAFASHFAFYLEDAAGLTCHPAKDAPRLLAGHQTEELTFDPRQECWPSGVTLTKGVRYVIRLKISDDWADADYPANVGGHGINELPTLWDRAKMILLMPLRRVLLRPWFRVIARVGETGTDEYFLDPDPTDIRSVEIPIVPNRGGELYLYVNDAVLPYYMDAFYRNNHGTATVTVVQRERGAK